MPEEKQQFALGKIPNPKDERDILYSSIRPRVMAAVPLPRKYSLRSLMPPLVDQGAIGFCVGAAVSVARTQRERKESQNSSLILSPRFAYATAKERDGYSGEGTYPRIAMQNSQGIGISTDQAYPYKEGMASHETFISNIPDTAVEEAVLYKSNGFALLQSVDEIKRAVFDEGAINIAFDVYQDYLGTDQQGIIQPPQGSYVGGHYVTVIGWDDDKQCLEIQNSWGTYWGEQNSDGSRSGFGWMPYTYAFTDAYVMTDLIDGSTTSGAPVGLIHPVKNVRITQRFGENPEMYAQFGLKGHNGTDYGVPVNTELYAVDDGVVTFAGKNGGYGLCIIVQTSWGGYLLGHCNRLYFGVEARVTKGQLIALSNGDKGNPNAGNSTGPHCHLGGWINGVKNPGFNNWVDLEPYIKSQVGSTPDKGFAFMAGGPGQAFFMKISTPDGLKEIAREHAVDEKIIGSVKDIKTFPEKGFALATDGKTAVFYQKLHNMEELGQLRYWNQINPQQPRIDFETL